MPYLKLTFLIQMHCSCRNYHIYKPLIYCCLLNPHSKILMTGVYKWTNVPSKSTSILFRVNQGSGLYFKSTYDYNNNNKTKQTTITKTTENKA